MLAKLGFLGPLFLVLLLQQPQETDSQSENIDISGLLKDMSFKDQIIFFSDYFYHHEETFHQLEDILVAALPILGFDRPPGWLMKAVFPWALDNLPYLLKNEEFLGIVRIFLTELNNHTFTPDWLLQVGTVTEKRNYFVMRLFSVLDYSGMLGDILVMRSNFTTRPLSEKCYNDTMSFFDGLLAGDRVQGLTNATTPAAPGVHGQTNATTPAAPGVQGQTKATTPASPDTVSTVNCTAMPDGAYEMGCRSYARCTGDQVNIVNCELKQVYNNVSASCDDPANVAPPCGHLVDCSSKANGRYADLDQNCHTWYTCQDDRFLGHNFCPSNTVFDENLNTCNWADAVPPPCGTFKG